MIAIWVPQSLKQGKEAQFPSHRPVQQEGMRPCWEISSPGGWVAACGCRFCLCPLPSFQRGPSQQLQHQHLPEAELNLQLRSQCGHLDYPLLGRKLLRLTLTAVTGAANMIYRSVQGPNHKTAPQPSLKFTFLWPCLPQLTGTWQQPGYPRENTILVL